MAYAQVEIGRDGKDVLGKVVISPALNLRLALGARRTVLDTRLWEPGWLTDASRDRRAWRDLQLCLAHHVLCRGPGERDYIIGALFALGLITPQLYRRDPLLASYVLTAEEGPSALQGSLRGPSPWQWRHRLPLLLRKGALALLISGHQR